MPVKKSPQHSSPTKFVTDTSFKEVTTQLRKEMREQGADLRKEMADGFKELRKEMVEGFEEVRRHMSILTEHVVHEFKAATEVLLPTREKVDKHEERIETLEEDVAVLKMAAQNRR